MTGLGWGQWGFVVKVFGLSALGAIALKTLGPLVPIPATAPVSLAIVLTPALVMTVLFTYLLGRSAP